MSYLVNGTNIAPIAYGTWSSPNLSNGFNCTVTGTTSVVVTITNSDSINYTKLVAIATPQGGQGATIGWTITSTGTTPKITFNTWNTNYSIQTVAFSFVIFGSA